MPGRPRERDVRFTVENGHLVRAVAVRHAGGGRDYVHRCPLAAMEAVAHTMDGPPAEGDGTTMFLLAQAEGIPYTQVNVALEFLKDRGVVAVRRRWCHPATRDVYRDSMVEYPALAKRAAGRQARPEGKAEA